MEDDHDEDKMEDTKLDNDRKCHWWMVFEDNDGGMDDNMELLHAKMWDL